MSAPPRLPRKPEARSEKVEDLVARVRRGSVRVPRFQRRLNWVSSDVLDLFDSLYRGYPVGSLLFFKRPAAPERLKLGPLTIEAPATEAAWWVVDGQQRITALTASLVRPVPLPARPSERDPYVVFFDPSEQRFQAPPHAGNVGDTWVELPYLLDATRLSEWVFGWNHREDEDLRRVVFEAGTRIRDYPIPLYLIETEEPQVAEQIFYRINQAGKPLRWKEVHKALFGGEGTVPSTLEDLADELLEVGMGRLDESRLLTCLFALRGRDPTRSLADHYRRDPEFLHDAVRAALPVLRRVLSFLRREACIPHLRLLPQSVLLDVLTRFFACHGEPNARSRALLSRWFWRTVLGAGSYDDRTLRRRGVGAVVDDEEESVQNLLALVRKERPRPIDLPASFDARADDSRIILLALAHLDPRDLVDGQPIDIAELLEREDKGAFVKILKQGGEPYSRSPANRLVQPKGRAVAKLLLERLSLDGARDAVLASHAIDLEAAEVLRAGDLAGFLRRRAETLVGVVRQFGDRMAAWDHSDRPSLDYLLDRAGVEA